MPSSRPALFHYTLRLFWHIPALYAVANMWPCTRTGGWKSGIKHGLMFQQSPAVNHQAKGEITNLPTMNSFVKDKIKIHLS